ncbi:hypothetical protein JGS22_010585 [Streptomyces sp. P38-E01]|uniref:Uncharacterized protein n=2 Tax=Streptomyces tardus TaxID=2780544 RepID=A0A949JDR2_9ACTN|nr:hypothetical protein [Streptomyces tardus]
MTGTPECPACARSLTALSVVRTRQRWGGGEPRPRPELWWQCARCGWVGYQRNRGESLNVMRRLEGVEGDCPFCGWDQCCVVSEPWWSANTGVMAGRPGWLSWEVCLECGTSNQRRADSRPQ